MTIGHIKAWSIAASVSGAWSLHDPMVGHYPTGVDPLVRVVETPRRLGRPGYVAMFLALGLGTTAAKTSFFGSLQAVVCAGPPETKWSLWGYPRFGGCKREPSGRRLRYRFMILAPLFVRIFCP